MKNILKTGFMILLTMLTLTACSGSSPYGDADSQRERSKEAQDEMKRETSR
jgi:hypothetical protein